MFLLLLIASTYDPGCFHECQLGQGQVYSCKATTYTGKAVAMSRGRYRNCDISQGRVSTCRHPYTGSAVLHRNNKFRDCELASGQVTTCDATGFNGPAIVMPTTGL